MSLCVAVSLSMFPRIGRVGWTIAMALLLGLLTVLVLLQWFNTFALSVPLVVMAALAVAILVAYASFLPFDPAFSRCRPVSLPTPCVYLLSMFPVRALCLTRVYVQVGRGDAWRCVLRRYRVGPCHCLLHHHVCRQRVAGPGNLPMVRLFPSPLHTPLSAVIQPCRCSFHVVGGWSKS